MKVLHCLARHGEHVFGNGLFVGLWWGRRHGLRAI
jgi:hypothetical protein